MTAADEYDAEEIARRRDEVVRRMANTPPQHVKASQSGKRKPTAARRAARKRARAKQA